MCIQCLSDCELIGEIAPSLYLVQARKTSDYMEKDDYGIVFQNDPEVVFAVKPWPDPTWDLTDEQMDSLSREERDHFWDWTRDLRFFRESCRTQLDLDAAIKIKESVGEVPVSSDGTKISFVTYLFHKMGLVVEQHGKRE